MNLHATIPLDEVSAAPTADDAVSRILAAARITDGAALLDALEARRQELKLSNRSVELLAGGLCDGGLSDGHLTKLLGPSREKSPSLATLDKIMMVLGLSFVLVRDPTKIDRMQPQWRPRNERKVRQRALSQTTISRARPHVVSELLRRASRPRWQNTSARDFLRAMVGDET